MVSQGHALNRGVLTEVIIDAHARRTKMKGTHLYSKETCPHCKRAKGYMEAANIPYEYHDVVREPRALYEMLARVKPIFGLKTPITVTKIWIHSAYIGGADQLLEVIHAKVEPNPDRGQCSLSPGRGEAYIPV